MTAPGHDPAWDVPYTDDDAPPDEAEPALRWERTWQPIDLTAVLSGTHHRPEPTIGRRSDDVGILYPGKVHTASSESEAGKTWLALELARQTIDAGREVTYLDFEDDEGGVVGRLLAIQAKPGTISDRFSYLRPTTQLGEGINVDDLTAACDGAALVVIDGITEAMTLHGLNPLDNQHVATFGRILPRRIAALGPAVLCLDHVTKDRETRGRYALGGVHKLNGLDGAAFILDNRTPFGIGLTGRTTIKIAKDRPGQLRRRSLPSGALHWFADLVVESHTEDFTEVTIEKPQAHADPDFRPTKTMAKAWQLISKHAEAGVSGANVQKILRGNAGDNRTALALLEVEGYITKTPHKPLKPYPPEDDE